MYVEHVCTVCIAGATVMSGATRLILVDAQKLWNKRCFCELTVHI